MEFISNIVEAVEFSRRSNVKPVFSGSAVDGLARCDSAFTSSDSKDSPIIEATSEAEEKWTDDCDKLSAGSLFRKTDSWIFGSNVAGKKHSVLFYFAGLAAYRQQLRDIAREGWKGFRIT